ncbi:hypothetical protein ACFC1R_36050 [Kitasatospora sp. NPDC056138]|uniref:hypothetical protein n=1 Tax=Kitasatospora sp. NPDC056138 TaxID=3345724 RepID=UPI0035E175D9
MTPAAESVPARDRGATVIPGRVVARIAARAGREALSSRSGVRAGRPKRGTAPKASAVVRADSARLRLSIALPYPFDLAAAGRAVQHQVARRVSQLTGLRVTEVTLDIRYLDIGDRDDQRVL